MLKAEVFCMSEIRDVLCVKNRDVLDVRCRDILLKHLCKKYLKKQKAKAICCKKYKN